MRVLVACEFSGVVRDAFIKKGHQAISVDFESSESNLGIHHKGDVFDILYNDWDLMIAHPPCTYLCSSGLHWNTRIPGREELTEEALKFVNKLLSAPIERIAIENPVGRISTAIRKPDQCIQPYEFGEDASKKTCLWLKNLPPLLPTQMVGARLVEHNGKFYPRWANQTDSGQNRLGPSETRSADRSRTYEGIALAMADQWGKL